MTTVRNDFDGHYNKEELAALRQQRLAAYNVYRGLGLVLADYYIRCIKAQMTYHKLSFGGDARLPNGERINLHSLQGFGNTATLYYRYYTCKGKLWQRIAQIEVPELLEMGSLTNVNDKVK